MSGGATLGNLPLPAYFFLVEFRFCLYRARGKTLRCIMGRQTLLIHPLRIFAVGKGNSRPILPCVAASKRRAARRPASHQNLLREIGSRFPLARTSKYSHSRPRQKKANPKNYPKEGGKLDSGLPGAAFVRGFTSRNWVVRAAECILGVPLARASGRLQTLFRPCLCNRLTLNQSVRERTVIL